MSRRASDSERSVDECNQFLKLRKGAYRPSLGIDYDRTAVEDEFVLPPDGVDVNDR
jgi:hypothetical protein